MEPEHGNYYDNLIVLESLRGHRARSRCETLLVLLDLRDRILSTRDQKSLTWLMPIVNQMIDEEAQELAAATQERCERKSPAPSGTQQLFGLRSNPQEIALKIVIEVCFIAELAKFVWHYLSVP